MTRSSFLRCLKETVVPVAATFPTPRVRWAGLLACVLLLSGSADAQAPANPSTLAGTATAPVDPKEPCVGTEYRQFDFWIGDWKVFDGKTGKLVGHDHIHPLYNRCVIRQDLSFLGDLYRRPGSPFAVSGISISRFDGQQWVQMWADNQWGAIMMKGARRPDGAIQLDTIIPSRGRDVRLVWLAQPGGVRIEQFAAKAGSGNWERYDDLVYRPEYRP
jgi:hypothetical protein